MPDHTANASWSDEVLQAIHARTGGFCTYCGCWLVLGTHGVFWEVDHWIPRSMVPKWVDPDFVDNLWPACVQCNREKSDTTGAEYITLRAVRRQSTNAAVLSVATARQHALLAAAGLR